MCGRIINFVSAFMIFPLYIVIVYTIYPFDFGTVSTIFTNNICSRPCFYDFSTLLTVWYFLYFFFYYNNIILQSCKLFLKCVFIFLISWQGWKSREHCCPFCGSGVSGLPKEVVCVAADGYIVDWHLFFLKYEIKLSHKCPWNTSISPTLTHYPDSMPTSHCSYSLMEEKQ